MPNLSTVEDTLFVPMLGRIYASEKFPKILHDEKALSLKPMLPANLKGQDTQTQYTLLASAVRSSNMDRYIQDFMKRHPDGIIAQLGCGLETTFYRNDNGKTVWYEIDLQDVIEYRKTLLPESERDRYFAGSAFETGWIEEIRKSFPDAPVLATASGLFYYFEENTVLKLFQDLQAFGNIEVVFDTVNKSGMKRMSKYMKTVGHEDAVMYFYVDRIDELVSKVGGSCRAIKEEKYYSHADRSGLNGGTKFTMWGSDLFSMVKMIHIGV